LNYIWNLKHNIFVIVRLTWMDQVAIVINLACCQYIRFKTLSFFFFHFKWELCHLVLITYYFLCFTCWPLVIQLYFNFFMVYIYLKSINKTFVIVWCCSFVNLAFFLVSNSKGWISWCQMGALTFGFQSLMKFIVLS